MNDFALSVYKHVCMFVCACMAHQIFAIFVMLTTLGNSRVTFQVHLNEKCVSGCCMNCYKTGVAYAHRRSVGFVNGSSAAEPEPCCSASLATAFAYVRSEVANFHS